MVIWATTLPLVVPFLGEVGHILGILAVVAGVVSFYATQGKTLSDVLTKTRVTYDMPPDERVGRKVQKA